MDYIGVGLYAHCKDPSMLVAAASLIASIPAASVKSFSLELAGEVRDGGVPFSFTCLTTRGKKEEIFGWFCPWGVVQEERFSKKRGRD